MKKEKWIVLTLVLVVLAAVCKYFFGPNLDWSGFSPVIAIALFSGFIIKRKDMSFVLPLLALLLSDIVIQLLYLQGMFPYPGFYGGQWKNYLILLSATGIGWLLNGRRNASLLVGAVAAPTVFFLLSNFSVWISTSEVIYSKDFKGLITSYTAGLPFYRNALLATLVFLPGILLLYNFMSARKAALTVA